MTILSNSDVCDLLLENKYLQDFLPDADMISFLLTSKQYYTKYHTSSIEERICRKLEMTNKKLVRRNIRYNHLFIHPVHHLLLINCQHNDIYNVIFCKELYSKNTMPLKYLENDMWYHIRSFYPISLYRKNNLNSWYMNIMKKIYYRFFKRHEMMRHNVYFLNETFFDIAEDIFYFEVQMLNIPSDLDVNSCLSIGFSTEKDFVSLMDNKYFLGWNENSIGIHNDDGFVYCNFDRFMCDSDYAQPFGNKNDTVGSGICFRTRTFFFCINGKKCIELPWKHSNLEGLTVYPCVVMDQYWRLSFNFGDRPFCYSSLHNRG